MIGSHANGLVSIQVEDLIDSRNQYPRKDERVETEDRGSKGARKEIEKVGEREKHLRGQRSKEKNR